MDVSLARTFLMVAETGSFIDAARKMNITQSTVSARIKGEPPGAEASIRKVMADEHGQAIMHLAKDLAGAAGTLEASGPLGTPAELWAHGFLYSAALTVGGGTGEVQRNIIAERVLGLPHDVDAEAGMSWAETRR